VAIAAARWKVWRRVGAQADLGVLRRWWCLCESREMLGVAFKPG
jgi:hypothetical protein